MSFSQGEDAGNTPIIPSTPPTNTQPLQATTLPLNTTQNIFSTPRRRKPVANLANPANPWPRIGKKVPTETLVDVTSQIFGYRPRDWQVKLAEKVLSGHDAIGLAGTGAGKSLVFAMLAIATELAGFSGIVIVICPLKSLQKDQVSHG
jgi:ATP-dependent helicase YprA (DUF1998 family)